MGTQGTGHLSPNLLPYNTRMSCPLNPSPLREGRVQGWDPEVRKGQDMDGLPGSLTPRFPAGTLFCILRVRFSSAVAVLVLNVRGERPGIVGALPRQG